MARFDDANGVGRRDRSGHALAALVGAVGMLMLHHPTILSGLGRVQVDLVDSRLINYFLEHNYLWYLGAPGHRSFWDPPFFYPARNIAAYSDTMLGIAPLYAAFRALGAPPDSAFQLWTLALSALNYAVMLHLLARRLGLSIAAASAGAFLFAFGSPRANMLGQQTQLTQSLSLLSVDLLFGIFAGAFGSRWSRAAAWVVAVAGLAAQLSSGFYPGWFTVLALGIVAAVAAWMPATRKPFLATVLRDAPWIALAGVLGGLAIRPWLAHHMAAARELGPRWTQWIWNSLPRPMSWLDTGPENWLGGWAASLAGIRGFQSVDHSIPLGIGLATTAAVVAGLYLGRHRASTRLLAASAVVLGSCVTLLPEGVVIASKSLLILGSLAFAFVGRKDHPRPFLLIVGMGLLLLALGRSIGDLLPGYGLFTLLIAASAFVARSGDRREEIVLGGMIAGLTWLLFPSSIVLGLGGACGAAFAGVAAVAGRRSRPWVEAVFLVGFLAFAVPISYAERPIVCLVGLGAPLAVLAARRAPIRPPAWSLPQVALVGLVVELFVRDGTAWKFFIIHVPGASSMIFVSRVGLILLIPAAIGLGYAIDALRARGRPALALGLGLICLLEQGTATRGFDKAANRETIAALARRIDGRSAAFYYTPDDARAPVIANLDAMWAGLDRERPTINGYSGHTPHGWRSLDNPSTLTPADFRKLVLALDRWKATFGRDVAGVQWIGGPEDRPGRYPDARPKDASKGNPPLNPQPSPTPAKRP